MSRDRDVETETTTLIETFKIVHRKYDNNPELFFQLDEGDRREHDQKLFKKTFRLKVRKYAFSNSY